MLYKFLYTIFTTVHLQWIRNISISRGAVYTNPAGTYVFIYFVYGVLPSHSVFTAHQLASRCFNLHKWNLELILTIVKLQLFFFCRCLDFDLIVATSELFCCLLLMLYENHSNSSCKSDTLLYVLHSKT